jgi:hypothetical protein
MRAILINAANRTVEAIELESGLKPIYEAIGCTCFGGFEYNHHGDYVYYDDESLFSNPQHFVELSDEYQPIAGNLLIVGTDDQGNSTDVVCTVDDIKNDIIFMDVADVVRRYG